MSDTRISIIIVPPGGARTVQRSISVFRAKLLGGCVAAAVLVMIGSAGVGLRSWGTAARGRALEVENDSLRVAVSRMSDLECRLLELERAGGRIRNLLAVNERRSAPVRAGDAAADHDV